MSPQLKRDLNYILPKLNREERLSAKDVLNAIEGVLPERKGAYTLREMEAVLRELNREAEMTGKRFCVQPYIAGVGGGTIFKYLPKESSLSYLALEETKGNSIGRRYKLPRHLVKEYRTAGLHNLEARYDGTLVLKHACRLAPDGVIEPSGEIRQS